MAVKFVRSGAGGAGTGADWANAYTTIATAAGAVAAGDTIWVADDHNESTAAAVTWTFPGTQASPNFIYCVDHLVASPGTGDLKVTGAAATTGNSALKVYGNIYIYGLQLTCGSGANAPTLTCSQGGEQQTYEACLLKSGGTSGGRIDVIDGSNQSSGVVYWVNSQCQFSSTSATGIRPFAGDFYWRNTGTNGIVLGSVPTNIISTSNGHAYIDGVDLNNFSSGNTVANSGCRGNITFANCKLNSGVVRTGLTTSGAVISYIRCDHNATNYLTERHDCFGDQTTETTIVRTGGATDGTTVVAWKFVTAATRVSWVQPFVSLPITIWNDSTSAITTLTFYGTTTGGGVPNNDDIWVEAWYPGSASYPLASYISSTKANNLAASGTTNNSSDGSTWGGGGAGNGFKIVVPSFTPGMVGPINIVIKVGKASSTYYIDPKPSISGVTVAKSEILIPGVYANELSSGSSGGGIRLAGHGGLAMGA